MESHRSGSENSGQSEVARIRQQIALEYEAVNRIFDQPAIVAKHEYIEARQARLGDHFESLRQIVPVDEAMQIFIEASDEANIKREAMLMNGQLTAEDATQQ